MGNSMNKKLNSQYSWKPLDHAKTSTTDALKTALNKAIQVIAEAIDGLIVNKTVSKLENCQ